MQPKTAMHEVLYQLPTSEFAWIAAKLEPPRHTLLDVRRCGCGGCWVWLADGEGFAARWHIAALA